jgi:spore germination protein YaaH
MRIHIVRPKETFVTIANKYHVTLDDLRQFNPGFIQLDCLVEGMKVYIPNLKKVTEAFQDSDHHQNLTSTNKIKQEETKEVSLTSTKHVISAEQNEEVLQNHASFTFNKENQQKPVIKKQVSANTIGKQKETKKTQKASQTSHATGVQTPKRKYYEPWPSIKRTAQRCQYYFGYCDHCR